MLNNLVVTLNDYPINAIMASKNLEVYLRKKTFCQNLLARFTFLAMMLIALWDTYVWFSLSILSGAASLFTFCCIKNLNKINFLIIKIVLQNIEVIASSTIGFSIHPRIGINYLNKGFYKIEHLNL